MTLAPDVTIADVVDKLANAEGYLRNVIRLLHPHRNVGAVARIGTSGNGSYPFIRVCQSTSNGEVDLAAYNDNGTAFTTADGSENWSSRTSTLDQVKDLLASILARKEASHSVRT